MAWRSPGISHREAPSITACTVRASEKPGAPTLVSPLPQEGGFSREVAPRSPAVHTCLRIFLAKELH